MSHFRYPKILIRRAAGSFVNGVWVEGATTQMQILCTVQPATGEAMQRAPEGRRNESGYSVFTDTAIRTAEKGANNPDIMVISGQVHECIAVDVWQNGVISHHKALFLRQEP
jgi:hypothetical protein